MPTRLSQKEVEKRIKKRHKENVILISEYKGKEKPITLKCLDCQHEWETTLASIGYRKELCRCPEERRLEQLTGKEAPCSYCGTKVYKSASRLDLSQSGHYYCSRNCGNLHKNQIREESGEWDNTSNYRRVAFANHPHECAACGYKLDPRLLQVHHIDSDRDNNDVENLIILCPTCHRGITLGVLELKKETVWTTVTYTDEELEKMRADLKEGDDV